VLWPELDVFVRKAQDGVARSPEHAVLVSILASRTWTTVADTVDLDHEFAVRPVKVGLEAEKFGVDARLGKGGGLEQDEKRVLVAALGAGAADGVESEGLLDDPELVAAVGALDGVACRQVAEEAPECV
jgi:hypothetical protein